MKILVVDDFPTMRRIIRNLLKQLGYSNVVEADDGSTALAKLQQERFDLIISDWNMPTMNGLELLKNVRENEELRHIPFLMVTADAERDHVMQAVEAGVSSYIVKPFTAAKLKEKMEAIVRKSNNHG